MAKWLALFALPLVFRAVVTATADSANLTVTVASAVSGGGLPPAGYNLDPAFSDDFNGASLDTTKWSLSGGGLHNPTSGCGYALDGPVYVSGGYLHFGWSYDQSSNTFHAPLELDGPVAVGTANNPPTVGYPPNYYWEMSWKWPNNGSLDNATWSFAYAGLSGFGYPDVFTEVDSLEYGGVGWFLWGGYPPFPSAPYHISNGSVGSGWNPNSPGQGNGFHTIGRMRLNGVYTFFWDRQVVQTMPDPSPPYFTNAYDHTSVMSSSGGNCPNPTGMPFELLVDYIRVYHP
jgi:hypothetical protein